MRFISSVVVGLILVAALLFATVPGAVWLAVCYPLAIEARVDASVGALRGALKEEEENDPAAMRRAAMLLWCRSWQGR